MRKFIELAFVFVGGALVCIALYEHKFWAEGVGWACAAVFA